MRVHDRERQYPLQQDNHLPARRGRLGNLVHEERSDYGGEDWLDGGAGAFVGGPAAHNPAGHGEPPREGPNRLDEDPVFGDDREKPIGPDERNAKGGTERPARSGAKK